MTSNKILLSSHCRMIYDISHRAIYHQPDINVNLGKTLSKAQNPNLLLDLLFFDDFLVKLFTDVSLIEKSNSVGSACVEVRNNSCHALCLNKFSSIFTADAIALNIALDGVLKARNVRHAIFTDSLSVLQALACHKTGALEHPSIIQAKNKIFQIDQTSKIENPLQLFWIPPHKGILGNEIADAVTKTATSKPPFNSVKVPFTDFKITWKKLA